jgi:hypothetical protein
MLKTYDLSPAMYFVLAAEARRLGMPFGGHVHSVTAIQASDSGARIVDHSIANMELMDACFYHLATVERCRPVAERFRRNGTWWVPTWIYPPRMAGRAHSRSIYAGFSAFVRKFLGDSSPSRSSPRRTAAADSVPRPRSIVDSLGYMYVVRSAGLPVLAGTDTYGLGVLAGFALHTELATYVAEGLTPLEALQTATLNPAKMLRGTDSLGSVAAGKLADVVLLDADPLADITNTAAIRAVVANGRYFDRAALDGLLAEVQAKANEAQAKAKKKPS